ncbi:MAG: prephenate dehydratase [Bacteroidia bacterium]|nr:prephenate dehydratase [Bacteroidia bacterium]
MESVLTAEKRIAIQGVMGSFHEIAARRFFGDDIELEMCDSFPALFRSLNQGRAEYGVMAIENSVAGTILPNYGLVRDSRYTIIGELFLRIEHHIMALPGQKLEDIQEVHSHPMAILQCHKFFEEHPHIRLIESTDTADSAWMIKNTQKTGIGAIASRLAAEHTGLEIMAEGIETHKRNFTRFLVLQEKEKVDFSQIHPDKSSLCFNLVHKVGSLSQILLVLSSHGMNLTKIQSLPVVGHEWQYFFHIDLEYEDYAQYQRSLAAIQPLVAELKILGEYERGKKHP